MSLNLNALSSLIQKENTGGASQVAYVMTTSNPVGLLLASSVPSVPINITTYADNAPNKIISGTAEYILMNNIQTNTQVYLESLGCLMTVQFWTYGKSTEAIKPPSSYPVSTANTYSTEGLAWTVVSCSVEPNPTTVYTTTTSADDTFPSSVQQANTETSVVLALSVVMIVGIFLLMVFVFLKFNVRPAAPLSVTKSEDNL
jgi:hypothetical protein